MTTFSPISLNCPVCETSFGSNEIGSCGYASKRTDFRPNYWGFNPVRYFYHLCPNCGFCAPKPNFNSKFENPELKKRILELGSLENHSLSEKLERAMVCLEILNELGIVNKNEFALANNWMDPFWWAETNEEMKRFGTIVLGYFEQAFDKGQVPSDQLFTIKYIMAEIHRRIGNKNKANNIFDEVLALTQKKENKNQENIFNLSVQQKTNPKENL